MSQTRDNYFEPNIGTEPKPPKRYDVTKRHVILWEAVLAAWAGIMGATGGGLLNYHYTASGIALTFGTACSLMYAVVLHYQHKFRGSRKLSLGPLLAFIACNALALGFAPFSFYEDFNVQVERFHVVINQIQVSANPITPDVVLPYFAFASHSPSGMARHAQLLAHFTIENEQQIDSTVESYDLAASDRSSGPWSQLCPLDLAGRDLYFKSNLLRATLILTTNFLEPLLLGKGIRPQGTISGWTPWECGGSCSTKFLKISLRETSGRITSQVISTAISKPHQSGIVPTLFITQGDVDFVTNAPPVTFESGCNSNRGQHAIRPSLSLVSGGEMTLTRVQAP